jgi:hypothetical protein
MDDVDLDDIDGKTAVFVIAACEQSASRRTRRTFARAFAVAPNHSGKELALWPCGRMTLPFSSIDSSFFFYAGVWHQEDA